MPIIRVPLRYPRETALAGIPPSRLFVPSAVTRFGAIPTAAGCHPGRILLYWPARPT
jgi:hypothetical protein